MYRGADEGKRAGVSGAAGEAGPGETWARVKRRLRAELGEDVFASWFGRLELEEVGDGCARLSVPTRFLKSWIEAHYLDRVLAVYRSENAEVERISVSVRGSLPREPATAAAKRADGLKAAATKGLAPMPETKLTVIEGGAREASDGADLAGAPLDPRLTFASFVVGRSNALAHAAADRVAHYGEGQALYNPLFLHAGVGLGKTHLLHAVGHHARAQGRGVIYLTADRFMYGFVAALKAQNTVAFKERLRGIDLLILDDVQFIQGKTMQAEFGHTLNALIDGGRQIVAAADRPPADLESLDERVRSRLAGGLVVEIGVLDEVLRASILQTRLQAVRQAHPGFEVSPAVVAYVARTITANGRDLEGAVNRLLAHATLTNAPVTVETAETAIRDLVRNRSRSGSRSRTSRSWWRRATTCPAPTSCPSAAPPPWCARARSPCTCPRS
jgi:chromosomal replication initiator protein